MTHEKRNKTEREKNVSKSNSWSFLTRRWTLITDQLSNKFGYCTSCTVSNVLAFHKRNIIPVGLHLPLAVALPWLTSSSWWIPTREATNFDTFSLWSLPVIPLRLFGQLGLPNLTYPSNFLFGSKYWPNADVLSEGHRALVSPEQTLRCERNAECKKLFVS